MPTGGASVTANAGEPMAAPRSDDGDRSQPKRQPKRRDPEKRRLQNMQAQKRYRENMRRRLEHLESIAASVSEGEPQVRDATKFANTTTADFTIVSAQEPRRQRPPHADQTPPLEYNAASTSPSESSGTSEMDEIVSLQIIPWEVTDMSSTELLCIDLEPDLVAQKPAALRTSTAHSPLGKEVAISSTTTWTPLDCGCTIPHLELSNTTPRAFRPTPTSDQPIVGGDGPSNSVNLRRICIIEAVSANCLHIGISPDVLCQRRTISPFYRTIGEGFAATGPEEIVQSVQNVFSMLKTDLRPTREQITIPHHPFVDALPFPTLRKNLIMHKDFFDIDTLYNDLVCGLACWGRAGSRTTDPITGLYTGSPWDSRSWEAKPWFLRKYWALLGGDEGELVLQSEWWRSMRGESTDLWLSV